MANKLSDKLKFIYVFAKIDTKRVFRDKTALFFVFAFPLIFLFIFGGIFSNNSDVSFNVAVVNESDSQFSRDFTKQLGENEIFDVSQDAKTLDESRELMSRGELDATIVLPESFGSQAQNAPYPSGQARIYYTQNNAQAGQTLKPIMEGIFQGVNSELANTETPFTVKAEQLNERSLSSFDYTFTGLLGFSIIGLGIFGPMNVFPALKKAGVLRRFHTTPLRVWQYFLANMLSTVAVGLLAIALMFAVAIIVFDLQVIGNWLEIGLWVTLGTIMISGIGLAIGGWARDEKQAAPLGNIVTFPLMFLSGTFFPRFLMPEWLQNVSAFLPLTPVIDGLRLLITEGQHITNILPQFGLLAAWMVVIYLIAFRVFRWE